MRPRWGAVALVFFLASLSGVRDAIAFETGREFLATCQQGTDERQMVVHLQCLRYLKGFIDAYQVSRGFIVLQTSKLLMPICLPEDGSFTAGVLRDLARGWLRRHPDQHNGVAATAIFLALIEAYPCEPGARKKK